MVFILAPGHSATQQKSLEDLTRKLLSGGASPPHIRPSPLSRRRVR